MGDVFNGLFVNIFKHKEFASFGAKAREDLANFKSGVVSVVDRVVVEMEKIIEERDRTNNFFSVLFTIVVGDFVIGNSKHPSFK